MIERLTPCCHGFKNDLSEAPAGLHLLQPVLQMAAHLAQRLRTEARQVQHIAAGVPREPMQLGTVAVGRRNS